MNCEYCGAAIPAGAGNCPSCGAAVAVQVVQPEQVLRPAANFQPGYTPQPGCPISPQQGTQIALGRRARVVYIMLAIFLGLLGIHNFYANRIAPGLAQLLMTIFLGWLIFPLLFILIWIIVECCVIKVDGRGVPFD